MYKLLISSQKVPEGVWFVLDTLNKVTYKEELKKTFKNDEELEIIDFEGVPFEFRHAGLEGANVADRFWDWKDYCKEDRELLIKYMEYTQNDESTLEQAKLFLKMNGEKLPDLKEFKRQRFLNSI